MAEPGIAGAAADRRRGSAALPAMALAAAMLLGGSGSLVPLPEIVLECLFAGLFAAWIWVCGDDLAGVSRAAWIVAALIVAVPLCQLLPLPPALWHRLPGRGLEQAALTLVGQGASWQPWSLTANRTLAALLAMAVPAAMLVMVAAQGQRGRAIMVATMAAMALLSVLVGAMQLSGGPDSAARFYNPQEAFLDGFQTNHNAQADVLLIGMVALAAAACDLAARRGRTDRPAGAVAARPVPAIGNGLLLGMVGGASLLLMLGVLLTASRTGIALLPVAIAAQLAILRHRLGLNRRRVAIVAVAGLAMLVLGLASAGAAGRHGALGRVLGRFHTPGELRPQIWHDALFALRQYWPWGSGMGSFIPVFAAAERLDVVTGKFVNRAHNDYLEFLIEAGLPGLIAVGVIFHRLAVHGWRGWQRRIGCSPAQLLCGAASLLVIALHCLDDYPLRTLSIACMTAVSAGLLLPAAERFRLGIG